MNKHQKLLSCWHKLEHFSPASTPKASEKNVELLSEKEVWKIPLKSTDPNKVLEYTIYLGVFNSSIVNNFVIDYFKNNERDENFRNSKICYASLKLDENGKYINDSFGLSSLPWALSQLENNKIGNDNWETAFDLIKESLNEYIDLNFKETITNSNNEIVKISIVVSNNQLLKLQDKVDELSNWSVKPQREIYVKRIEKFKPKNDKESTSTTDILNSFYIKDLERIISNYNEKSLPKAFKQYLDGSVGKESERIDIIKDVQKLKSILTPTHYPDGCWPSDYTLSLMQQFAVNTIFNNLSESNQEGLFSVNGPPGTGKTTLLRDIIAPIIVKRAKELSKIENPSDAFEKVGSLKINGKKYSPFIYEPLKAITNGGIVIASSNNGAVENISKELPLKKEVSKQYRSHISYFKAVAEQCIHNDNWGLISAVLGNKQNSSNLVSNLWFNTDFKDLQSTLKEDKIVNNSEWNAIRITFKNKLDEISLEKKRLTLFEKEYEAFISTKDSLFKVTTALDDTLRNFEKMNITFENQKTKVLRLKEGKKDILNELAIIKSSKPGFSSYWLNKNKRNIYKDALETALNNYNQISENLNVESSILVKIESDFSTLKFLKGKQTDENFSLTKQLDELIILTDKARLELKNNYADADFWKNIESKKSQESCPWYSGKLKKLQSELFIISLNLNEIFILTANATSSRISTTLGGFFEYLKGDTKASKQEIKAMWNTFFLVIPVISSSFASIQMMFKDLNREDVPWLFIDEAGQAIPQAAAGSIWRSKRVGVVGDPFQIEPVVTIPKSITDNISRYFDLDKNQINSELSVQSMADRINPLGSYLTINSKKEWIGMPLRVHRRCINPMFEISNRIAYDNTMYNSTVDTNNVKVKFQTSFIHCIGNVVGKHFVQEQADIIKELLKEEINFNKSLPDVFVITPFSEISSSLNSFLFNPLLYEIRKYKEVSKNEMSEWLKTHIGTVHTFQGKQAEGVILCLGLDEKSKGAANWASQKPNLLNVAVTRAKYRFIAIGDKEIWNKQAYFNQLTNLL
ncbi:DEAD/DEAH box helicase [Chryseobacterium polytrichastri]|uniref:Superfamily I DNA and/or RNA helicase n=1 Tax=Chryseobacterium polytrichastri TaxID=1302687 RepID=A0A1M7KC85_9FLAO|nr:AAA domain-containing protein [Chryseobacterium polytrichastri]SHM62879.1 Superfamily I DNA and/or RNA helicase [Chryseobacterium polytrichastri]